MIASDLFNQVEGNSMTKAEIIDAIYEKVGGFSKKEAAEIVEAVFDSMKDVLTQGEKIKISGFGNFVVRYKKQRIGRNPQTGEPIPISARRVLTFKPSQVLKAILNPHKSPEGEADDLPAAVAGAGLGGEARPDRLTPVADLGSGPGPSRSGSGPFGRAGEDGGGDDRGGFGGGVPPVSRD
jgi:integration host factor subunit alpha